MPSEARGTGRAGNSGLVPANGREAFFRRDDRIKEDKKSLSFDFGGNRSMKIPDASSLLPEPLPTSGSPSCLPEPRKVRIRETLRIRGYGTLLIRPIQLKDESLMVKFHQLLSEDSVHARYFELIALESRIEHERLKKICRNSAEAFALVVESSHEKPLRRSILGVGRISRTDDPLAADFAVLVINKAQGHGIGSAIIKHLISLARTCGFKRLTGQVLVANHEMIHVCRQFGFSILRIHDGLVEVNRDL